MRETDLGFINLEQESRRGRVVDEDFSTEIKSTLIATTRERNMEGLDAIGENMNNAIGEDMMESLEEGILSWQPNIMYLFYDLN